MFRPFAANADGVQFQFLSDAVFVFLQIFKQRAKSRAGELAFPSASAEGVNELMGIDGCFHGLILDSVIAIDSPPEATVADSLARGIKRLPWKSKLHALARARTAISEAGIPDSYDAEMPTLHAAILSHARTLRNLKRASR